MSPASRNFAEILLDGITQKTPGHAKSLLIAVFWPARVWIDHPEARWLFSSYREPFGHPGQCPLPTAD
jgi:hypothetical protein